MQWISASLLLTLVVSGGNSIGVEPEWLGDSDWLLFKATHNKTYTETSEEASRRTIWLENNKRIRQHNAEADDGKHTFWLGMNVFGDMTADEVIEHMTGLKVNVTEYHKNTKLIYHENSGLTDVPDEVDWRKRGFVTGVKYQGSCGGCYAFSAAGALEALHYGLTGSLKSLSAQNLLDCSQKFGNHGCRGGFMDNAFRYVRTNNGIDTDQSYPYNSNDGKCRYTKKGKGATCKGYRDLPYGDELALKDAVGTKGPVSVGVDAMGFHSVFYRKGVFQNYECKSTHLNHALLIVGYGRLAGLDYWLLKNSWGTSWGDGGYIRLARNRNNMCGVASLASYPVG